MFTKFRSAILIGLLLLLLAACVQLDDTGNSADPTEAPAAEPTEAPAEAEEPEASDEIIIGLITKTETNPFFVKMKEGAQAKADELGVELMTAAGTFDGDNESQVTAIENMVSAGAAGILITPSDTSAIVPAIENAREAGVIVIALDTPTDPEDATDALYATDNFKAGLLIGEYAQSVKGDDPAKIALLNLAPGITVGQLRRDGFVEGFGIEDGDPQIVCEEDTRGDQAMGQTAMENCLTKDPDIDVVYTINEPAAFGAYTALEAAGRAGDVLIVSVDGGCAGVEGVNDGRIAATSQQYPLRMASLGVENIVAAAQGGSFETGYTDTGVTLITNDGNFAGDAEDGVFGIENCWGDPSDGALEAAQAAAEAGALRAEGEVIIGLITKTETNPFFVKMKEGAQAAADAAGATLMTAAGTFDGDNESQVTAIENMVAAGATGILITPSDTSAIVPAIENAREAGVVVIALDTPTNPEDATDALFATDNFLAGILIGEYARSVKGDDPAKIALLNLAPGITVGQLRRDGFVEGYGIEDGDPQIVCEEDTRGDQAMGQTAMENCLTKDPDIDVVYTINEPAAFGAYTALEAAGRADDVLIVSVDGGCSGVEGINDGRIAATSQQYPLRMASLGVEALIRVANGDAAPSGYTDTGVTLITNDPNFDGDAENGVFGIENCWGDPSDGALDAAQAAVDAAAAAPAAPSAEGQDIIIGLITKTETNPFFVKMKEGAQAKADELGVELMTAAGTFDGDNESQVTAIENMVSAGAQGILITPSDTSAIVPAIERARAEGVIVIALDTPTDPEDATDALYATDNFLAGILIGEYARSVKGDEPAKIALLNLAPGITVGQLRRDGFVQGYGIEDGDPQIVCEEDTRGDQAMGQTAMENCLTRDPEIDVVYTINEPAAFGAYTALEAAGRADDVLIVSVDGGCAGVEGIIDGRIAATSQQYPLRMASLGVENIVAAALGGDFETGYTDTGVTLITNDSGFGGDAENAVFGIENCWGDPSEGALDAAMASVGDDGAMMDNSDIVIGLITKTETNPFFVKMKEGAQEKADELGVTLMTAAGTFDGDNESQVTAIENMVSAGAAGILITPSDTSAIVPAIERAREAGVIVIALDTPTDPEEATDALYATDNFQAGILIGEYARETVGDEPVKIALLNLAPGITVGQLRRDGFVQGFGIEDGDPQIVCEEDTRGDQAMGQTAMENCLTRDPEINVVYTINEPAAFGAYTALEAAGRADDVLIVSVDGGCAGVRGIVDGQIAATSQQYPLRMASLGVENIVAAANGADFATGYTDTGVTLITDVPADGVDSEDTVFGLDSCWGD